MTREYRNFTREEKISFKNIDVNLVLDFIEKQEEIIDSVMLPGNKNLKSDIFYQINGNILSVKYTVTGYIDALYENCEFFTTLNIDLKNKRKLTTNDIFSIKNIDATKYATKLYNDVVVKQIEIGNYGDKVYDEKLNEFSIQQYFANKNNHINKIENNFNELDVIIKDNKVNIMYNLPEVLSFCLHVAVGGCFEIVTDEL